MSTQIKMIVDDQTIELESYCYWNDLYKALGLDSDKKNIVSKSDGLPLSMLRGVPKAEFKTVDLSLDTVVVVVGRRDGLDVSSSARKVDHLSPEVTSQMTYERDAYQQLHFDDKIVCASIYGGSVEFWHIFIPISRLPDDDATLIAEIKKCGCDYWLSSEKVLELARKEA